MCKGKNKLIIYTGNCFVVVVVVVVVDVRRPLPCMLSYPFCCVAFPLFSDILILVKGKTTHMVLVRMQ